MAIYKFKVRFEEYDDVTRDIEVKAVHTFRDLHDAIIQSIGFDGKQQYSFYFADEYWKKGKEFSSKMEKSEGKNFSVHDSKFANHIIDPHQKIYFVIFADTDWEFQMELMKIAKEELGAVYPRCVKTEGVSPKQYVAVKAKSVKEDFDFIKDEKYEEAGEDFEGDGAAEEKDAERVADVVEDEFSEFDNSGDGDEAASPDAEHDA